MALCTSVLPRFGFSKCIGGLQMSLHLSYKCHLVTDGTLSKYLKLCLTTWCHSHHQLLFLQSVSYYFIFPVLPSSLHQNKTRGLKQVNALWLNIFF